VDRIAAKKLKVRVKVVGLGIGGSIATSGLAKAGIPTVAYEKRAERGLRSVTSRYQNASWRAYDIAAKLVDESAYNDFVENRQKINVIHDDGTTSIVTSDRVQIILGQAIQSAIDSARRYGAELHFESDCLHDDDNKYDIVAFFAGTQTAQAFNMTDEMAIMSWPELDSHCNMWLRLKESDKAEPYCSRGGEIGAEKWHYTIESARASPADVERIIDNLDTQHKNNLAKPDIAKEQVTAKYQEQRSRVDKVLQAMKNGTTATGRYDYIFTNAPKNEHNLAKRQAADKDVVLDGGYTVQVKMASNSSFDESTNKDLLKRFNTDLIICGGDACVPPNPLAAYGATLACEAAGSTVQLATGIGHMNAILEDLENHRELVDEEWISEIKELKRLLGLHYEAKARAENYFQFVQTMICNLYSLKAQG
jgi:hypothetical protein